MLQLIYTLCFCKFYDEILMMYRNKPPNQYLWNGLGGKIEKDETPEKAAIREIKEEADLQINEILYTGIVTWKQIDDISDNINGMYVFIAVLHELDIHWNKKNSPEGLLEFKKIRWITDINNHEVVENIPHFLPPMLEGKKNFYQCLYRKKELLKITTSPLRNQYLM